jgi:hypothetical protein
VGKAKRAHRRKGTRGHAAARLCPPYAFSLIALLALAWALCAPASAIVGGAPAAEAALARHVVMIVSRTSFCTGVVVAPDLVLTAAHCTLPGADYGLMEFDAAHAPVLHAIARIAHHPQFDLATLFAHRATADVALIKLAAPLGANFAPAPLAAPATAVALGDTFTVAGFGVAVRGDGTTGGKLRAATLVATGQPGTLQIRLMDAHTKGERAGLGACTGDSGAPVFVTQDGRMAVAGVVSWTTGPKLTGGCGGLTGVTPLTRYRDWIVSMARQMGSAIGP